MEPEQPTLQKKKRVFGIEDLPSRPKPTKGDYGKAMRFIVNYYPVKFQEKEQTFYQYEVTFEPEIERNARKLVREVMQCSRLSIESKIGCFARRGSMIWGFRQPTEPLSFHCELPRDKESPQSYLIFLKKTKIFPLSSLMAGSKQSFQVIHALNGIIKKNLSKIGMVEIGRNSKFFDKKTIDFNHVENSNLRVWRGYTATIQIVNGSTYLMVDPSMRVLRSENLFQTMKKMKKDDRQSLIGLTVLAPYGNYQTYKINGFNYDMNPSSTFKWKGVEISFRQYFKKAYGVAIKELDQHLINTLIKRRVLKENKQFEEVYEMVYLLPELVFLTGMSDQEKANNRLCQEVSKQTKLSPTMRRDFVHKDILSQRAVMENELFTVSNNEAEMEGMVLHPPTFVTKDREETPTNGLFNIRSKILSPISLDNWIVIFSKKGNRDMEDFEHLLTNMIEEGKILGIKVSEPAFYYPESSFDSFKEKITNDIKLHGKPQIVMTCLSNFEGKFYSDLKKLLYLELFVPHQNVLKKTLNSNKIAAISSNILLQMVAKLGQPLWRIKCSLPQIRERRIAMGSFAIYHKLINKNQSCVAFCGTVDRDFTRYFNYGSLVPQNTQRIDSMYKILTKWLQNYFQKNNNSLPNTLILYREGVGEGQITTIGEQELPALQKAIEKVSQVVGINYKPEVIYLLVNKKVSQRIFEKRDMYSRGRGGKGDAVNEIINPSPGSVVSGAMSRYGYGFFMVPQQVTQGTATPTHYIVVHNNSKLSAEALITLTYEQCYNYFNWKGAIRVPGSLMYANKQATMVGEHLKSTPIDEFLSSKPYYL